MAELSRRERDRLACRAWTMYNLISYQFADLCACRQYKYRYGNIVCDNDSIHNFSVGCLMNKSLNVRYDFSYSKKTFLSKFSIPAVSSILPLPHNTVIVTMTLNWFSKLYVTWRCSLSNPPIQSKNESKSWLAIVDAIFFSLLFSWPLLLEM